MRLSRFAIAFSALILLGCDREPASLIVKISTEEPAPEIAETMQSMLESVDIEITIQPTGEPEKIISAVLSGDADLGIVEEPPRRIYDLTTVVPLYPSILHVMHRKDRRVHDFTDLIEGQQVYAGPIGGTAWRFLQQLARDFMLEPGSFTILPDPWQVKPDVYFILGGLLAPESISQMPEYEMFGFGDSSQLGSGTAAEGLALKYPNIRPFVLPDAVYGAFNDGPVLTLSTRTVLVAREDLDIDLVYSVARELFEHAYQFSVVYPLALNEAQVDMDSNTLALPLHRGSRNFIDKDKPNFFEENAEVIGVVLTLAAAIGSGFLALLRLRKNRKKDRIDIYYRRVLEIRDELAEAVSHEAYDDLECRLKSIQEEVFGLLISEQLNVDESLTLFLDLSNRVLGEISAQKAA